LLGSAVGGRGADQRAGGARTEPVISDARAVGGDDVVHDDSLGSDRFRAVMAGLPRRRRISAPPSGRAAMRLLMSCQALAAVPRQPRRHRPARTSVAATQFTTSPAAQPPR